MERLGRLALTVIAAFMVLAMTGCNQPYSPAAGGDLDHAYTVYVVNTENFCFADDTLRTVLGDGTEVTWNVNEPKTEATAVLKSGYALSDLVNVDDEGYPHVYNFVDDAYCYELVLALR